MGRKKKTLTDEQVVQLEALAAYLNQRQIADYFGMSDDTLRARMEEDEQILRAYKRGRATAISDIAKGVLQRARDGDNACAFFYLKTQAGWKETQRHEHETPDGPLEVAVTRRIVRPDGDS